MKKGHGIGYWSIRGFWVFGGLAGGMKIRGLWIW